MARQIRLECAGAGNAGFRDPFMAGGNGRCGGGAGDQPVWPAVGKGSAIAGRLEKNRIAIVKCEM